MYELQKMKLKKRKNLPVLENIDQKNPQKPSEQRRQCRKWMKGDVLRKGPAMAGGRWKGLTITVACSRGALRSPCTMAA